MRLIEGKAVIDAPVERIVTKKLPVFYNPVMKLNRDVSILLMNSLPGSYRVADVLAGSGVRSIRFLKECKNIEEVFANDSSPKAVASIKRNAKLNKVSLSVSQKDASTFLLQSEGFNYIEIDPFGSPNPFLDSAVKRISRNGILAVTATDTSALAGSHPKACVRKYWGIPLRFWAMHEFAIRLLARKAQLVAGQYDKALTPVFCHSSAHYVRLYFRAEKGKAKVDAIYKQHKFAHVCRYCLSIRISGENSGICCKRPVNVAGPLWTGQLWERKLVLKMKSIAEDDAKSLLDLIAQESRIQTVGFHDWYRACSKRGHAVPKKEVVFARIEKAGFDVAPTHFSVQGLRSAISSQELLRLL